MKKLPTNAPWIQNCLARPVTPVPLGPVPPGRRPFPPSPLPLGPGSQPNWATELRRILASKQDVIADLRVIRSGAAAGATAVRPSQIARFVDGAEYRQSYGEQNKPALLFKHGSDVIVAVDATPFVKDGMVSGVAVSGGKLVITFNTDSGKQPIEIPLTDIFDPNAYYDKSTVDAKLAGKASTADATLTPVYGGNGERFSEWTPDDGLSHIIRWDGSRWVVVDEGGFDPPECYDFDATSISTQDLGFTATRTENPIIGYQLGLQSGSRLGPLDSFNFASPYSSFGTYAVGDLCFHNGQLYKCSTAISAAETWNPDHWLPTTVEEALAGKQAKGMTSIYPRPMGGVESEANKLLRAMNPHVSFDINGSTYTLPQSGKVAAQLLKRLDATAVAPEYSSSATYATGDLCVYSGKLYRCSTAIPSAEAWDATHWTATTVDALTTLTPIYSDTPTFSEWVCSNPYLQVDYRDGVWGLYPNEEDWFPSNETDPDATAFSVDFVGMEYTATRTRTDIIGYQLGTQTDKPLASEAEAIALRQGKLNNTTDTMSGSLTVSGTLTVGTRKSNATVGIKSTAEGYDTTASGNYSHAEGIGTTAQNDSEHAQGSFNVSHSVGPMPGEPGNTLSSIGFGTSGGDGRRNAVETMQDGKTFIYGLGGYDGFSNPGTSGAQDLAATVNAKANRVANPTAGNLAALDAQGNPTDSGVKPSDKLDATSAAPAFSTSSTYAVGDHVTYNGKLYRCTTAVATAGAWDASKWTVDTMTDPDAVLDVTSQNQLRVIAKDGTLLWAQGYDLASTSSATLACNAVNNFTFADGATTQAFTLPTAPTGKVGDFGLDIDNSANASAATMTLTGLDTTFSIVVQEGESLTDMCAIAAGELARFYITLTTFRVNNLPTWHIVKQVVENGGATA